MKLRIRGNSLRLRLTKSEVARVGAGEEIEEIVDFGGASHRFIYALVPSDEVETVSAVFDAGRISVFIPLAQAARWSETNQIGIETEKLIGGAKPLQILIEKDFSCLEPRTGEDDADTFAHPFQSESENQIQLKEL